MLNGLEVNRLKQLLITMYRISQDSLRLLKQQIIDLKANATNESQMMRAQIEQLIKAYDDLKMETHNHERELIQRLTVDHELEMNDLTKKIFVKDDEIITLKSEKEQLESDLKVENDKHVMEKHELVKKIDSLEQKVQELEKKISQQTSEKEAALKALKEDHRSEIESLRCKFKLMTSSKTSPSETSLDRVDTIDISSHEAIIAQMRSKFEEDMQQAVQEAVEKVRMSESNRWSLTASLPQASSPGKSPKDNQEIFKRILDEKDRQLEQMREHVEQLLKESDRLKGIIQSITDENQVSEYKEELEKIQLEKVKVERELEKEKSKRAKLNNLAQNGGGVTINSCSKDDIVLVVWNSVHEQYTVVQDSSILYFLHAESYNDLKLTTTSPNACPRVCYCIGKVTDKEYCHAKKDENRYKVGKGTKFYRVKVRARSPTSRGEMERSATERKKIRRSTGEHFISCLCLFYNEFNFTDSQSDSSKSMKLERQPSNLIDSFAQTETRVDNAMATGSSSSDMVDSGVGSQHNKLTTKEQNPSTMEDEDEDISLTDTEQQQQKDDDDDKKDDEVSDEMSLKSF